MTEPKSDLIAASILHFLGERCPDYISGCSCCRAWGQYDDLMAAKDEAAAMKAAVSHANLHADTAIEDMKSWEERARKAEAAVEHLKEFEGFAFRVIISVAEDREVNPNDLIAAMMHLSEKYADIIKRGPVNDHAGHEP